MVNRILNETTISRLSLRYGFVSQLVGNTIKIKSKNDTWYIANLDYNNSNLKIYLYHENSRGKTFKHYQNVYDTLNAMFKDIASHDSKYIRSFYSVFRMKELLQKIKGDV
jgi:hypothetical protein